MSVWSKFYEQRVGNGYFNYAVQRYEKFIFINMHKIYKNL